MKKSAIILMACLLATLALPSCEKLMSEQMLDFYEESLGLKGQKVDSIERFKKKVEFYLTENPDESEHLLYPKIVANIEKITAGINVSSETSSMRKSR